jgi:putative ABC transport system ATP-binding protein
MPALHAEGICKTYESGQTFVQALTNVGLSIHAGSMVALLGPSGSGKSTLIKALGLVSPPDSGRIWIEDRLVVDGTNTFGDLCDVRRKKLGFVFQRANLIPFLTAQQNVQIAGEIADARHPSKRAEELLRYLEVAHRAGSFPRELSGGEQQRVAVARALANGPALVLADEPTAALDGPRGRSVMELFRRVAREQTAAVLVVTHDHRTLDLFDELHEMEDGRLKPRRAQTA